MIVGIYLSMSRLIKCSIRNCSVAGGIKILVCIYCFILLQIFGCRNNTPIQKKNKRSKSELISTGYKPKNGFISSDTVAIEIAIIVLRNIYGNDIYNKQPYKAVLIQDSIWRIIGTLPKKVVGGVPFIEIRKSDGMILKVWHGK
ncbi:MAG: NTF2 fold immunity protein [Bacteroidota bacterium]